MTRALTSAIIIVCFVTCSHKSTQRGMIYFNDFETIKGWNDNYLSKRPTHSGLYSNCLDSTHSYGSTCRIPFREVWSKPIKKIKINFWAYYTSLECRAKFALDIKNSKQEQIFWISNDMESQVKEAKKWTHVFFEFTLVKKDINLPDYIVSLYPWNQTKKEIYIDDITLEFVQ